MNCWLYNSRTTYQGGIVYNVSILEVNKIKILFYVEYNEGT